MVEHCRICGTFNNLETHHIKPLSEGGKDIPENVVFLCRECHDTFGRTGSAFGRGDRSATKGRNLTPVGSFYLGRPYMKTWQEFRAICVREGTSASKKLVEFITDYTDKHSEGNPQTLLKFGNNPRTLPLYKTCQYSNKEKSKGEFYCTKTNYWRVPEACTRCDRYEEALAFVSRRHRE